MERWLMCCTCASMLVDTVASQEQTVKIVPEMNSKDLLERRVVSIEPGNGGEVFAII